MKLLADENVEAAMVEWLRETGHDVAWAVDMFRADADECLLQTAQEASRVLLTRDRDFGELVYRDGRVSSGIVLVRIQAPNQHARLKIFQRVWSLVEEHAPCHFVVISNHQVRIRPLPPDQE